MMFDNLLSALIWLPIAGGALVLVIGDGGDAASPRAAAMRWFALGISLVTLVLSVPLYTQFDTGTAAMQFVERLEWIPRFMPTTTWALTVCRRR